MDTRVTMFYKGDEYESDFSIAMSVEDLARYIEANYSYLTVEEMRRTYDNLEIKKIQDWSRSQGVILEKTSL